MSIERKHTISPRISNTDSSLPSWRRREPFGGIEAREESFKTSQRSPALVAGGGSSGERSNRLLGGVSSPFGGATGRSPAQKERGNGGGPNGTSPVAWLGRTAANGGEEIPAAGRERESAGEKRERRERKGEGKRDGFGPHTNPAQLHKNTQLQNLTPQNKIP